MFDSYEVRRLVRRYERAFENGREKLYEELDLHIGVLEMAIATIEEKIDELSEQLTLWGDAIAYAYVTGETIGKFMIFHRFIMFVLQKYAEYKYNDTIKKMEEFDENSKKLKDFLFDLIVVKMT